MKQWYTRPAILTERSVRDLPHSLPKIHGGKIMESRPTFTPYLVVSNAAAAIDFYKNAFGAAELVRHPAPGTDKIMHAHLVVHGGHLMLSDDFSGQMGGKSETPEALGGSPVTFHIHTENADDLWAQALAAGEI